MFFILQEKEISWDKWKKNLLSHNRCYKNDAGIYEYIFLHSQAQRIHTPIHGIPLSVHVLIVS